ncbi:hypothetical protein Tsubulata_036092, partial [Turnera subulata]
MFKSFIRQFYKAANEAVPLDLTTMSYRELVEKLVNYLERKRYLVVLDDVWDTELWNKIKVALPNSRHGCRVIITTRMDDIAAKSFEVGSNIHHIKAMEENQAWTFFCMKAFPWNARSCPHGLEDLARDVVQKCQGLPLAVVSLGGLFSTKHSELEWKTTCNSLNWELSNNSMLQPIKSNLLLSYNDLPYRLKSCFLCCCLFPEVCEIERERLARLWMAEGFIEDVDALPNEIVNLKNLRYLVSSQLKDETCGTWFPPKLNTLNNLQVLGMVEANNMVVKEIRSMTQLVRLDILNIEGSHEEDLCFAIQNMRVLRRLYVTAAKKDGILCLDALKSPPPFLEFLGLSGKLENIPQWFKSLQNLRHLRLNNLEFLGIYNCPNLQSITIDMGVMPGLKKLTICDCRMLTEVPSCLMYLTKLQQLLLVDLSEDLIKRIEEPCGVDRPNVHHIPIIIYRYETSSGWFPSKFPILFLFNI